MTFAIFVKSKSLSDSSVKMHEFLNDKMVGEKRVK